VLCLRLDVEQIILLMFSSLFGLCLLVVSLTFDVLYIFTIFCILPVADPGSSRRGRERGKVFPGPETFGGPRHRSKILKRVFQMASF